MLHSAPPAAGFGAVAVSLLDAFQRAEWRTFRASMFVCLGTYGAVPLLHAAWAHSDIAAIRESTRYDLVMGALYLVRGAGGRRRWGRGGGGDARCGGIACGGVWGTAGPMEPVSGAAVGRWAGVGRSLDRRFT